MHFWQKAGDLAQQNNSPHHMKMPLFIFRNIDTHATATGTHTYSRCGFFVVAVFVRRVMDHPGDWIYPETRADMISSQVPVSGNIAKMCQWEKESVSRGVIWYDAFHIEAIAPPAPTSNKKKKGKPVWKDLWYAAATKPYNCIQNIERSFTSQKISLIRATPSLFVLSSLPVWIIVTVFLLVTTKQLWIAYRLQQQKIAYHSSFAFSSMVARKF